MSVCPVVFSRSGLSGCLPARRGWSSAGRVLAWGLALGLAAWARPAGAVILWSDSGPTLAHETGEGEDIIQGAVKRDDSANDTLYFKFHINPISDASTEEYFAAFELYERDTERLGVGNALKAWAYSAFFNQSDTGMATKYEDLHSSRPEPSEPGFSTNYELPRRGTQRTIVFKVQYESGGDDLVTVWLDPDLGPGANEVYQPESLTTRFNAHASFDEIRLRHGGGGGGWIFSDMAVATSFSDFVDISGAKRGVGAPKAGLEALPLSFQTWQRDQGMPRSPIRALSQTLDGYIWLGSDEGLTRFDGARFVPFDTQQGMPGGAVRALFADSRGRLWIGTAEGGLICHENGQFKTMTTEEGLPSNAITAVAEDKRGQLWIGTDSGLIVWWEGHVLPLGGAGQFKGRTISTLFSDRQGTIWVGAKGLGIFHFDGGRFVPLTDPAMDRLLQDSHCLLVDEAGRTWVGAGDDSLLCLTGGQWQRYRLPHHSPKPYINTLAEEPDGTIWAGSVSEGLFQFKDGKLTAVNANSGLSDNLVGALLVDREGKMWVGADSALNRLQHKNLHVLGQEDGLGYGEIRGLAEVSPGVIWAVKPNDGLYEWQGGEFSRLTVAGLYAHDPRLGALLVTRDGSCWVACTNGLLYIKDPQAAADESTLFELTSASIISLAEDRQGRIWAGTREGELWRLAQGAWTRQDNLSNTNAITAIVAGTNDVLWVGTDGNGLFEIKDRGMTRYGRNNGLADESIRTLYAGSRDTLWISGGRGGLSRLRDGRVYTYGPREGVPETTISQIMEDDSGRLWLGGSRTIYCVSKRELDEVAAGNIATVYPHAFGRADGMPAEECSGGFFPAGLKAHSGLLWFPTLRGIVVADPRHHQIHEQAPTPVLEEVLVDGAPARGFGVPGSQSLRIPPGKHRFELQYTALGSDAPDQVRFRYKMEGLDSDWADAGTRRTAFYNYVPPGNYRFRVIACNSDGVWNQSGTSLGLTVSRHFWQIWWVNTLAAVGLLVTVSSGARVVEKRRLQRRLRDLEQERALERERTRIAQDLHDEMGAKLCRISFLSEHALQTQGAPGEVEQQISTISDASRELLHSLDEIVWAVNPQNDTLEHVASYIGQYAQDYFQLTGVECELDIPAAVPDYPISAQARHHLFLAVHEAFTNTLKHSKAAHCKVSVNCRHRTFQISVTDDGGGFDPAAAAGNGATTGNGLRNMTLRLATVGGSCRIDSLPGSGTTVRFIFPIHPTLKEKDQP